MYPPSSISAETLTHVNYAFALISNDYQIIEMAVNDNVLWLQTTALKKRNAALKVFLSIGGWSFNDPPTQNIFSNLVGSAEATNTFIASALSIMQAYSFDGVDIDWEYPVAPERGGATQDKANYPIFMARVKAAFAPRGYQLTFTAPSSFWYLQHFDLPALLQSADWVNVMTYDLHGTWDGTDPWIGPVVNAHTNLTEIKETMQLFQNVGVNPSQIVLGIGFYGRSFQLADGSCSDPGCPFVGGADPGLCSLNSGTLMFSEIEQIINNNNLVPVFDSVDAVKYISRFVVLRRGSRAWRLMAVATPDDSTYSALSGLYGDVTSPSLSETGNQCQFTGCGQQCPSGYNSLTTVTQIPNTSGSCDPKTPARLCCPPGNEPQNCLWRGGGGTTCNAQCNVGEIVMALDEVGGDGTPTCIQGYKAFCCQSGEVNPGACFGTSCSGGSCVSGYTAQTHVKQGSADNGLSCEQSPQVNKVCPEICQSNTKTFLPVPENWVFPQTFENSDTYDVNQPATFTADFDDNTGTSDTSSTGSGSSGVGDDGKENDSAFGEVFISSPNPSSVSSLDIQSDWVITGCDATSDQPQEVLAYCSKGVDDDDSGCSHVFLGGAEHTIVKMPTSCGLGPYARVSSLEVHPNQDVLPREHQLRKRSTENVYSLKFDYNFLAVPESNGPVLMRADMTDIPGYWDEMVNSAPDSGTTSTRRKRDYHMSSGFEKRWFGPFDAWLAKLNTVRSRNSIDRNFHWSDTYTIYHAEEQCPNFSSSLDISVTGYEQSMSALFVDYLAQFPDLWQNTANNKQFCNWVSENLIAATTYYPGVEVYPTPTVFGDIGQCYPGGTAECLTPTQLTGGNAMVILEQQSNVFKNTLLYYQEAKLNKLGSQVLMDSTEFSNYCSSTQIAKLRAAAAVPSYMNDYTVKTDFLENNACIRDIWVEWYGKYLTSNVDAPNKANVNVPNLYDNWISTVVNGMVPFLRSEITRLIPYYNDGATTATDVDLSFAILLDDADILNRNGQPMDTGSAAFTIDRPTTRQDLITYILNEIPDISWASSLPRH
ncbi:hypothetical protein H0H93_004394 [Arthromyces matolae]|nr:hypothetical protein H0H93_004394 [Arthromyces matolae]